MAGVTEKEPMPERGEWYQEEINRRRIYDHLSERDIEGQRRYGGPLVTFDGRDAVNDAYQEALDCVVYLAKIIREIEIVKVIIKECVLGSDTLGEGDIDVLEAWVNEG